MNLKQQGATFGEEDNPTSRLFLDSVNQKERSGTLNEKKNISVTGFSVLHLGKGQPVIQDGSWAWVSLVAAALVQFIVMGIHNSFGVVYREIVEELGWRDGIAAFIGSAAIGLNFLLSPIGTQLSEFYSPQTVTILGGTISVAGLLGVSFVSTDYGMLLSYSVVWGIGSSLCYSSSYVVVGKLFRKHMAVAMGIVTAGSGLGQLAMGPSIENMLERFGWKTTMRSLGALASCLILAAFTYREPVEQEERISVKRNRKQLFDCSLWVHPAFLILTVSLAIFNFGYYTPIIHVPRYAEQMGSSKKQASWLISFMSIPSVISRLAFGKLADLPRVNRLLMFQICLGMMALSTILCPFVAGRYVGFALYMIIFGTGEGCIIGTAPTLTAHIVGRKRMSPALGLLFFSFAGPLMAGPFFAGWLYSKTKRYEEAFFVAGGTMLLCLLLLSFLHWLAKKPSAEYAMEIHNRNVDLVDQNSEMHVYCHASGRDVQPNCMHSNTEELPLRNIYETSV